MMSSPPHIHVTGDVVIDNNIYKGKRQQTSSRVKSGTRIEDSVGGSRLLHTILKQSGRSVSYGLNTRLRRSIQQQAYAEWQRSSVDDDGIHWHVKTLLGYNDACYNRCDYSALKIETAPDRANVVVLDDGYLGFRNETSKPAWPTALLESTDPSPWVVLKMARPLGTGALWDTVTRLNTNRLILVISINDLRRENAMISKGLSWERTAGDLAYALRSNGPFQHLRRLCRHIIVTIGQEGTFCIHDSNERDATQYRLFFDALYMEGERAQSQGKTVIGNQLTFTAGFVYGLTSDLDCLEHHDKRVSHFEKAVITGIRANQQLVDTGHLQKGSHPPAFPAETIAQTLATQQEDIPRSFVPNPDHQDFEHRIESWTLLENNYGFLHNRTPLAVLARRIVQHGETELFNVPSLKIKNYVTVDRTEIENLRNIRNLVFDYVREGDAEQPLSIAIFGPPGAGKSFAVKQLAKEGINGKSFDYLVFNLSQFSDPNDLIGAFHQVRDSALRGNTPFVFWDEFDAQEYRWLQYLLAPMQDGQFQEGQMTHPIGKCIFFFAGATSYTLEQFGPKEPTLVASPTDAEITKHERELKEFNDFVFKKGPDFKSRLHGYLNVLGPNPRLLYNLESRCWEKDEEDYSFPVRRALFIRGLLRLTGNKALHIDWGVLNALISIPDYLNGSRSMSKLLSYLKSDVPGGIIQSSLPSNPVLSLCVPLDDFKTLMVVDSKSEQDRIADILAPRIHASWLGSRIKPDAYDRAFNLLPMDAKLDNIEAARRIQTNLNAVGLELRHKTELTSETVINFPTFLKQKNADTGTSQLEVLAEKEHEGWMKFRRNQGWTPAEIRNDYRKHHPSMVMYSDLSSGEQDKDRDTIKKYPDMLALAGYVIVEQSGSSRETQRRQPKTE